VGSMLCCALTMLDGRFSIRANGEAFSASHAPIESNPSMRQAAGWRRLLPEVIKSPLREAADERHRRQLLNRLTRAERPPAVVLELYKYGSELGLQLSERRRVPLIVYFDAPEVVQFGDIRGRRPPSARRAAARERESLRSAAAVIVYSEPVKRFLVDIYGCDPKRLHVFQTLDHTRMSVAAPPDTRDPPTIGYVGSFMFWHNLGGLIDAFDILRSHGTRARLLLVGSGMARVDVERRIGRSPYRADIVLSGFLDGQRLAESKSLIDVAVLPGTQWYNLPTKVFEYGAASLPTVAPESPTVTSIFPSGELRLFRPGDAASLAAALEPLCQSPELRRGLGAALGAKVRAEHCDSRMKSFYIDLLDRVIAGASGSRVD
jgi:glycosyltransferase involved in cell wall biosynthesis